MTIACGIYKCHKKKKPTPNKTNQCVNYNFDFVGWKESSRGRSLCRVIVWERRIQRLEEPSIEVSTIMIIIIIIIEEILNKKTKRK